MSIWTEKLEELFRYTNEQRLQYIKDMMGDIYPDDNENLEGLVHYINGVVSAKGYRNELPEQFNLLSKSINRNIMRFPSAEDQFIMLACVAIELGIVGNITRKQIVKNIEDTDKYCESMFGGLV